VACEPGAIDGHGNSKSLKMFGIPYTRGYDLPSPLSSRCIGLALIRGVCPPVTVSPSSPPYTNTVGTPTASTCNRKRRVGTPCMGYARFQEFLQGGERDWRCCRC